MSYTHVGQKCMNRPNIEMWQFGKFEMMPKLVGESEVPPRAILQALSVENPLGTPTFSQFPDISCSSKNFQTIRVYGEKFVDKL